MSYSGKFDRGVPQEGSAIDAGNPAGQILFIGSSLAFSDWTLRAAQSETGNLAVRRCETPDPALIGRFVDGVRLHLVVLDESHLDAFLAVAEGVRRVTGPAHLALAYRDAGVARALLGRRQRDDRLRDLRLLPMNVPIDVWTSMFRLVLWGDFFVPSDLLCDTEDETVAQAFAARPLSGTDSTSRQAPASPPLPDLTPREKEVLHLVARGCRNKIIAHELGVSEHTVKLHIHHIITKIGVRNRTAAATWFLSQSGARPS